MALSKDSHNLIEESESLIKSTSVVIGTSDYMYTGDIIHFTNERLLDVLNKGSVGDQPELPNDFIQLHDMKVCSLDGQKINLFTNSLIAKSGTLFVGQEKINEIEIPCLHWNRLKLFISKKAVCVEIHIPSFIIIGNLYIEPWQRLIGALNDDRKFLPVTHAIMSFKPNFKITKFEFLAINKNHINCIAKREYPTQDFYHS